MTIKGYPPPAWLLGAPQILIIPLPQENPHAASLAGLSEAAPPSPQKAPQVLSMPAEPCAKGEGEEKQLRTWKEARRQQREVISPSLARRSRRQRGGWLANTLFSENTHSSDRSHPACQ